MYCTKCGAEINDEAIICPKCGCYAQAQIKNEEKEDKNGMAIAGFVCSFFIPILGFVFGGIGLARANKRNGKFKGFSIAAIAIASVVFIINLLAM